MSVAAFNVVQDRPSLPPPMRAEARDAARPRRDPFMDTLVWALPDLRRYARHLTHHAAEANDLVQETCRRAIESRSRFALGSDMRAWLRRILRNLHVDAVRRSSRERLTASQDVSVAGPPEPTLPLWARVSDRDLEVALQSLQPQLQRAYVLHAIDGRSYVEIARALHVPCSTVGTRILRARLSLRAFLLKRLEERAHAAFGTEDEVTARA